VTESVVKIQRNKNITLLIWLLDRFQVKPGDFVLLEQTRAGVLMKPAKLVDPSQAYFWAQKWQSGEREAEQDVREARVKRFKKVRDLMKELRS